MNNFKLENLLPDRLNKEKPSSDVTAFIILGSHVQKNKKIELSDKKNKLQSATLSDAGKVNFQKIAITPEQIKRLRTPSEGNARHSEERFAIVFQVTLANGYVLKTTSAPICVITNDSQKQIAQASILYSYLQNDPFGDLKYLDWFEVKYIFLLHALVIYR